MIGDFEYPATIIMVLRKVSKLTFTHYGNRAKFKTPRKVIGNRKPDDRQVISRFLCSGMTLDFHISSSHGYSKKMGKRSISSLGVGSHLENEFEVVSGTNHQPIQKVNTSRKRSQYPRIIP